MMMKYVHIKHWEFKYFKYKANWQCFNETVLMLLKEDYQNNDTLTVRWEEKKLLINLYGFN